MHVKINPIRLAQYKQIVFLTGAGISVASGLPTYRGQGGLWEKGDTAKVSSVDILKEEPQAIWQFFGPLRKKITSVEPNAAHFALANLEQNLSANQRLTVITQNIDQLHQRSGSRNVVELHGSLFSTKCSSPNCTLEPYEDFDAHESSLPQCTICGAMLRPNIVLFGEMIPAEPDWLTKRALRNVDLFIAVGTSGLVSPACDFVRSAKYAAARTVLVNLEPMLGSNSGFDEELLGPAEEVLPKLLAI